MAQGRYNVLFLSNRNTARSILAEAVMSRVGGKNFKGFSAGMHPARELVSLVEDVLRVARYATEGLHPKSWQDRASRRTSARFRVHPVQSGCWRASAAVA